MNEITKAVYIHIPFCKTICSYCDFCKVLQKRVGNAISKKIK